MPKRRNKGRKKPRKPPPQLPRPRRGGDGEQQTPPAAAALRRSTDDAKATTPASAADRLGGQPADRRVTGTVLAVEREFIQIDVDGGEARIYASELMLDVGEMPSQRYAVGDRFDAFVFQMEPDPESGLPQFSIRRATPYPDALNRLKVGAIVDATVVNTYDLGIELDIDGVRGSASNDDLASAIGESPHDRYQPGDALEQLFIWQANYDTRGLYLSVRRNAPGYVEALAAYSVGDLVSGVVTSFSNNSGLWLAVDGGGVIGRTLSNERAFADDQSAQDRYSVGDTVNDLFVWQVNHDARDLYLSVQRNAPGYVKALTARRVGEVVSGVVTGFQGNGGLWLDVDGVVGGVPPDELVLADGQSTQDRYAVDDTVNDLFVWQINHAARDLFLSMRRNAPGYDEALAAHSAGEVISGVVTQANEWGIWLDAAGIVAWIAGSELALDEGESPRDRYADGDIVAARVWQIDRTSRTAILSVRRLDTDFIENQIAPGATVDAVVRGTTPRGTRSPIQVLVAANDVEIPPHELSLSTAVPPTFNDGEVIPVMVIDLDEHGRPTKLSHRQALDRWEAEVERLTPGTLVARAYILPGEAHPGAGDRLAVDLGAITGLITDTEIDLETATNLMKFGANVLNPVVVESVDRNVGIATVSQDKFAARWQELAADLQEGEEIDPELRDVDGNSAFLDLGSGLLAEMPIDQLSPSETTGATADARIGENIAARIARIDHDTQTIYAEKREHWLEALIGEPESQTLDFKEVLKGDKNANDAQEMPRQAIRTINAFLNADGGRLIIGVHDKTREIVGLEGDPGLIADTIEKKIDIAIQILEANLKKLEPRDLRVDISTFVEYEHAVIDDRTLLVVTCQRGPDAGVVVNIGKGKQEFWVRAGQEKVEKKTSEEQRAHLLLRDERASGIDKS